MLVGDQAARGMWCWGPVPAEPLRAGPCGASVDSWLVVRGGYGDRLHWVQAVVPEFGEREQWF